MSSPPSTPLKNVALAFASTLFFAGLIEGIARPLEPPTVQRQEYLWDWSERFKDGEFYTLEKGEGYPPNEENNVDGLRDVTRPVETRDGLKRVVILGDSVTFGHGLEAHEAFPALLEKKVRQRGFDADVFNLALPGWSTRQERIAYERIARKYKPTDVLLAVCLNDLAELQINLGKPPAGWLLTLFKHSAAIRMAMGSSRREIGAVEELFTESGSARVESAFELFFKEVAALRDEVAKDRASFRVVVFPFRFQTESGAPAPVVQRKIGEFAKAQEIPMLDFLPETTRASRPESLFLDYDHFNAEGHLRIADWLVERIGEIPKASGPELVLRTYEQNAAALASAPVKQQLRETVLSSAVDDPAARVRFQAARTLFYLGLPGESSVPALIRGVEHDDPRVRAFATWTLGEMGPTAKDAIPALVALAKKDGGAGKTGALTAIGKIGGDSPEAIPLLLQELKHPKENRRYRAARTIGRMGPAGAGGLSGLVDALKDPSQLVRLTAVQAIGELGEAGKAAVPALTDVINKDPDPQVRKEASAALSKLPGR